MKKHGPKNKEKLEFKNRHQIARHTIQIRHFQTITEEKDTIRVLLLFY